MWKLVNTIEEVESPYNGKIKVIKTLEGTRLLVGGISQSGWLVKRVWKSALKKIKKLRPEIKSILILGLGGGSVAELVEEYWPGVRKVGIDIDPHMVDLGRKYLRLGEVSNLTVVIADAIFWIKKSPEKFDLILVDVYKGGDIPEAFRTKEFIKNVQRHLKADSIAAFNHLYSYIEKKDAEEFKNKLSEVFPAMTAVTPEANIIFICHSIN
ncbi:MAG: hypothetical protein A3H88_02245 [Candidatus Blackburnbacteria bacterium RIFCSPLOWO2_02_FULL_44_9]|uniref:PABS domain-containing protein n=1 Tax=Candidatus Blackburnbacteria bacterium RIFCSPHIGHO2_02_FULL_44_20 TaxID=1797516 RepID=A0A1G1V764_9BACT|nr:MAG: hypothetical protein A3D26_02170 [Candidatus Blackburnbacteria bacterium RIFCSPHIGHO2_02_FULL_44_20]OGY15385.1 MAG: hypothetical protein A3H88_02245 [Candidatus Blackburnbacteria bacterium RIFCSPLOWO2_02_FULL_44_9]